jgi:hypothetical protein
MGLPAAVQQALGHLYERWDGQGMPGELRGEQIPRAVRLMQVAQDADMAFQRGGAELVARLLAERAGSGLDPQAVAAFQALGDQAYADLATPSAWDEAMLAEPGDQPVITEDRLDACLSAVADFADLKSMWSVGHSRGVAQLAEQAAVVAGLGTADVVLVRRAALVHDIGRVGVPVSVWAKRGPGRRRAAGPPRHPAGRPVRARVPGPRPGGPRAGHQAGRPPAGDLAQDLRPPHPARVRQGRGVHPGRGHVVRAGARARQPRGIPPGRRLIGSFPDGDAPAVAPIGWRRGEQGPLGPGGTPGGLFAVLRYHQIMMCGSISPPLPVAVLT